MKIYILHASAGEGHRRAAIAVGDALKRSGVSNSDIIIEDALDFGGSFFKNSYTGFYYWFVKNLPAMWGVFYGWLDNLTIYNIFYPIRRVYNGWHGRKLLAAVTKNKPELIICTHFFSAEILGHARKHRRIQSQVVVLVTDFHPVRVWMHDGVDSYWVLSEEAKQTLVQRGVPPEKIIAGGFPITASFQISGSKQSALKKFDLDEKRLTVLLTTGSFGLGEQERLLELLNSLKDRIQCLVVCGRNSALETALKSKQFQYPCRVFGFVDFMSELMDVADLIVAKPGGATTAEAMAKRVPMIATGAIPGQETENLKFLLKENAVFSAETPEEIVEVINKVSMDAKLLDQKRQATDRICNPRAAEDVAQMRFKWIP